MSKTADDIKKVLAARKGEIDAYKANEPTAKMRAELTRVGITDPVEQANVLAQIEAESAFKPRSENLKYSAKRLYEIWGPDQKRNTVRFKTLADAKAAAAKGEEHIASLIYDGRKDLGNTDAGDGFKFHGRGFIQLTGKDNYRRYGKRIGVDLVANPDLANDPDVALKLAAEYFSDKKKKGVDFKDIAAVTKAVGPADPNAVKTRTQLAQKYLTPGDPPGKKSESTSQFAAAREQVASASFKPPALPEIDLKPAQDAFNSFLGGASQLAQDAGSAIVDAVQGVEAPALPEITPPKITPPSVDLSGFGVQPSLVQAAEGVGDAAAVASSAFGNFFASQPVQVPGQAPAAVESEPAPAQPKPRKPKTKFTREPVQRPASKLDGSVVAGIEMMADRSWIADATDAAADSVFTGPPQRTAASDLFDAAGRGANSGMVQIGADFHYAQSAIDFALGNEEKGLVAFEKAQDIEYRSGLIAAKTQTLEEFMDEPTLDGFFNKAASTVGQVAPSLVGTISTGFVGAIAGALTKGTVVMGGRTLAMNAAKKMVRDAVKKKATGNALDPAEEKLLAGAYQAMRAARGQGAKRGAVAGAFAFEYPQMTGASMNEFGQAGVDITDPNYGRSALVIGGGLAAVGVFGEKLIVEGVFELATKKAARLGPKEGGLFKRVADDMVALGAKGAAVEGTTETVQEGGLVGQRMATDDDYSFEDAKWRLAESAFAGALVGGAAGGAGGVISGVARTGNVEPPLPPSRLLAEEATVLETLKKPFGLTEGAQKLKDKFSKSARESGSPQYAEDYEGLVPKHIQSIIDKEDYTPEAQAAFADALNDVRDGVKAIEAGEMDKARELLARAAKTTTSIKKGRGTDQFKTMDNYVRQAQATLNAAERAQANPQTVAQRMMDKARALKDAAEEKLQGGRADVEETDLTGDGPTFESIPDLEAQLEHIVNYASPKQSMWVPENTNTNIGLPEGVTLNDYVVTPVEDGLYAVKIPGQGVLITRDKNAGTMVASTARLGTGFERELSRALGYSAQKPADADRTVAVFNDQGRVISEEATNAVGQAAATARAQQIADAHPGSTVLQSSLQDALRARRDRAGPPPKTKTEAAADRVKKRVKDAADDVVATAKAAKNVVAAKLKKKPTDEPNTPPDSAQGSDNPLAAVKDLVLNELDDDADHIPLAEFEDRLIAKEPLTFHYTVGKVIKAMVERMTKEVPLNGPVHIISAFDPEFQEKISVLYGSGLLNDTTARSLFETWMMMTAEGSTIGGMFVQDISGLNVFIVNTQAPAFLQTFVIAHEYGHAVYNQAFNNDRVAIGKAFAESKTGQAFAKSSDIRGDYNQAYRDLYRGPNYDARVLEEWFADQYAAYMMDPSKLPDTTILGKIFSALRAKMRLIILAVAGTIPINRVKKDPDFEAFMQEAAEKKWFASKFVPDTVYKRYAEVFTPDGNFKDLARRPAPTEAPFNSPFAVIKNMTDQDVLPGDMVSFPLPASRALKNLPARWKDAKALLPVQWTKALLAAGLSKIDMDLVVEPLLKELAGDDGAKRVSKEDFENGLRLVEPRGQVLAESPQPNRSKSGNTMYDKYMPDLDSLERMTGEKFDMNKPDQDPKYTQYIIADRASNIEEHNWQTKGVMAHVRVFETATAIVVGEIQSTALQSDNAKESVAPSLETLKAQLADAEESYARASEKAMEAQIFDALETAPVGSPEYEWAASASPEAAEYGRYVKGIPTVVANVLPGLRAYFKENARLPKPVMTDSYQHWLKYAAEATDDPSVGGDNTGLDSAQALMKKYIMGDTTLARPQATMTRLRFNSYLSEIADIGGTAPFNASGLSKFIARLGYAQDALLKSMGATGTRADLVWQTRALVSHEETLRAAKQRLLDYESPRGAAASSAALTLWSVWERNGLLLAMNAALDAGKDRVVLTNGAALHPGVRYPRPDDDQDQEVGYNRGLVEFYDKTLPNIAKKVAKALGAKVEVDVVSMPISPGPRFDSDPMWDAVDALDGIHNVARPPREPDISPYVYTIVLTPEAKAALMERRAQFEDGGKTYTRFMTDDEAPSEARADALRTEDDAGADVVASYSPQADARKMSAEEVKAALDKAFPAAESYERELQREEFAMYEDDMSDSMVNRLVKLAADEPDSYFFIELVDGVSGEERLAIKRVRKTGEGTQSATLDSLRDQLVENVDKSVRSENRARPANPGEEGATSIVVVHPDGKRVRPSLKQLVGVGSLMNRTEGTESQFLGDTLDSVQAARMGMMRVFRELIELGYKLEIDPYPLDGTARSASSNPEVALDPDRARAISMQAAMPGRMTRPLRLSRADLAKMDLPKEIPQLADQMATAKYTYADLIKAQDARVVTKEESRAEAAEERYRQGPRKQKLERLSEQWIKDRNAIRGQFSDAEASDAEQEAFYNEMSDKYADFGTLEEIFDLDDIADRTNPAKGTKQRKRMLAFLAKGIATLDANQKQRMRDQELTFDPADIEGVVDTANDMEQQQASAYIEEARRGRFPEASATENIGRGRERENDATGERSTLSIPRTSLDEAAAREAANPQPEEAPTRPAQAIPVDVLAEYETAGLPTEVGDVFRANPQLFQQRHIDTLNLAREAGALKYMRASTVRRVNPESKRFAKRIPAYINLNQDMIPLSDRAEGFWDDFRILTMLVSPAAAMELQRMRNRITQKQLALWTRQAEKDGDSMRFTADLGKVVRGASVRVFPEYQPPSMDLQQTVIKFTRSDYIINALDSETTPRAPTPKIIVDLQNEIDKVKKLLEDLRTNQRSLKQGQVFQGQPDIDAALAQLRRLNGELAKAKSEQKAQPNRSTTRKKVQPMGTPPVSYKVHGSASDLVRRMAGVAHGLINPNRRVDIFMASDLTDAALANLGLPDSVIADIKNEVAKFQNPAVYGALISRNRHIIVLNDLHGQTEAQDARHAVGVAHEYGHILLLEEGEEATANLPMLVEGYAQYSAKLESEGRQPLPFEEWYSDQVAAYVYKESANQEQTRAKGRTATGVERRPKPETGRDKLGEYFIGIAKRLRSLFDALNKMLRGRLTQSIEFVDYFEGVIASRKGKTKQHMPVAAQVVIKNMAAQAANPGQTFQQRELVGKIVDDATGLLRDFMEDPMDTMKRTFYASEDYLRSIGLPTVAKFFYGRSQSGEGLGFHKAVTFEQNRWFTRLAKAIGLEAGKLKPSEIDDILFEAEDNTVPTAQLSPAAAAVRKVFDEMYDQYLTGPNGQTWFSVRKAENYNPRQINVANIIQNPQAFADWLVAEGYRTQQEAAAIASGIAMNNPQQVMGAQNYGPLDAPYMPHGIARTLGDIPTKALRDAKVPGADPKYGWLQPPQLALTRYIHYTVRKVEYERRGGKDFLKAEIESVFPKGTADHDRAVQMVEANLGKLGDDIRYRPRVVLANSIFQTWNVVTTLTFAALASLPDLAGVIVRSKDFSAYMTAMREFKRTLTAKENQQLARSIGVVTNQAIETVFMSPGEMDYTSPWAKNIMDKFFVFTGTDAFTRFTRSFAVGMGREFLINTANDPEFGPRHERWLSELGVTRQDVQDWIALSSADPEKGLTGESLGSMTPDSLEAKIANAIARFADESVIRPDSAMKPGWASNPYFAVVWQLKSYFYAYGKTVVAGMAREFRNRSDIDGETKQAYMYLALALGAMLPLTIIGLETREWVKYLARLVLPWKDADMALQTDSMDMGEYAFEVLNRSGLLGPMTLVVSTTEGIQREGIFGPVISNVPAVDLVDDSVFDGDWSRLLPVVNNL